MTDRGTRSKPMPLGSSAKVGDWVLVITEFLADATDSEVAAGRKPPDSSMVYAYVRGRATYEGSGRALMDNDLSGGYVGSDSRLYPCDYSYRGDGIDKEPQVYAGGTIEGHWVVEMPRAISGHGAIEFHSYGDSDVEAWWDGT